MTRQPDEPLRLDRLIRAQAIHSMTGEVYRALGTFGSEIAAVSTQRDGLDDLIGADTAVTDAVDLTLLPAFDDAHEHLMEASRNTMLVPVDGARSLEEFLGVVGDAARSSRPGEWIVTSMGWHESNLAENRLPTGSELEAAAPHNPVIARRGGHLAIANAEALRAAGVAPDVPDPAGGVYERDRQGSLTGLLEGGAVYEVFAHAPELTRQQLAVGLGRGSSEYASLGVGTIREAMIDLDELIAYQDAADADRLAVRVRPMIRVGNELSVDDAIAFVRGLGARSGFGDERLRIWGLKFVLDGGVEGDALEEPYDNDPNNSGHLNWDLSDMTRVCVDAVQRGWRIATHAAGDRAVRTLLDVYEGVVAAVGPLPPWTLVVEHALLSDATQRDRAVRGGFGVTVQHTLLWNMGSEMLTTWGPERTRHVNPVDDWLTAGASLAAGTDMARPLNPMLNVWGMATRNTKSAGVQGPEHAIPVATALALYTLGSAQLEGESDRRGSVAPGKLADLVAYSIDPLTADVAALADLTPVFTVLGGEPTHDPEHRLS